MQSRNNTIEQLQENPPLKQRQGVEWKKQPMKSGNPGISPAPTSVVSLAKSPCLSVNPALKWKCGL